MHTQTSQKAELFARALRTIVLGVLAVFACATTLSLLRPSSTEAATSGTINFQARLQSAGGAIAPDGNYNVSFHLFNSSTAVGGTSTDSGCGTDTSCEWTEIYLNNNSQGVRVANGYLTVNLGSITAFSGINWDQQQWLTMDIGNTNATCTPFSSCSPDGQMSPRLLLTATPYAFSAGQLALTNGSNRVSLQLTTPTVVSELITLPDAPSGSATVCYQTSTACGFAASSGSSAAFIQGGNAFGAIAELGNNSAFALNFRTNNTDKLQLDTSGNLILQQASTLNVASAAAGTQLTIQGGAATSGTNAGGNLLLQGGAGASTGASGSVIVKSNTNNSTTAFQVQNASGIAALTVDTTNSQLQLRNLNDGAVPSTELFGNCPETFTSAGGWTIPACSGSATATHTSTTNTLTASPAITPTSGASYKVTYTISGYGAGSVTAKIGGVSGATNSANGTFTDYIFTTGTGNLTFTPTTGFTGTISSVLVEQMISQTPMLVASDSTGADAAELRVSTGANSNIGLGYQALTSTVAGIAINNTALGAFSLDFVTTGSNNTGVGNGALDNTTIGSANTAVGNASQSFNVSGHDNTSLGALALNGNATGNNNTALGSSALFVGTGNSNSALGFSALKATTSGTSNTALGASSGRSITTGSTNVFLGTQAGYQDSTQTDFQTLQSVSNATLLGANTQATCSTCIVIGGQGANAMTGTGGSGVGIGTPNPTNFLSVEPLRYNTGTVTTNSTTAIVGSGTTFTAAMVGSEIYIASNSATTPTYKGTIASFTDATHITVSPAASYTLAGAHYYILYTGLQMTATGNVGIQTLSPSYPLDVTGVIQTSGGASITGQSINGAAVNINLTGGGHAEIGTQSNDDLRLFTNNADRLTILAGGNVGIGTTAPDAALSVKALSQTAVVNIYGVSAATDYGVIQVSSSGGLTNPAGRPLVLQPNAGNVLIGTTINSGAVLEANGSMLLATWSGNSNSAFQIQDAGTVALVTAGTSDRTIINNATSDPGNLLENGGFESTVADTLGSSGATGWGIYLGSIVTNSANAHSGNRYLSIPADGLTDDIAVQKYYRVAPGDTVYAEGWIKSASATGTGGFWVQFLDKDKANISWIAVSGSYATAASVTSWTKISGTITAPANTAYINMATTIRSGSTGTWNFDDVVLKKINSNAPAIVNPSVNTTTAFQVQNTSGSAVFVVDTSNSRVGLNGATPGTTLDLSSTGTIQGAGLSSDCSGTGQKLLWSSSTKQFSCGSDRSSLYIQKAADQTVNNSTTLVNDNDFSFAIGANETWVFQMYIDVVSTSTTAGFKYQFTAPSGATCKILREDASGSGSVGCSVTGNTATVNGKKVIEFFGIVSTGVTSGTVQFQWAQNAATVVDVTEEQNNWLLGYKESGADYAETYYTNDTNVHPGDVVSIDGSIHAGFARSQEPYDHKLLGVVSTQPGQVIGDASNGGVPMPIALAGRVPVKVSTENGPIQPGDPLTSSSTPGVAMRATGPGYVLGKALTGYDNPDQTAIGGVVVFMNLSWADPSPQAVTNNASPFSSPITQQTIFKADTDSASAFQIQNTQGQVLLNADTANMKITVGNLAVTGTLSLRGHFVTEGSVQGAMALPAAGVDASRANDAVCLVAGNDTSGGIALIAGSEQMASGTMCTITFANLFDTVPHTVLSATDQESLEIGGYLQTTQNTMTLYFSHPPQAHHRYNFNYWNPQ